MIKSFNGIRFILAVLIFFNHCRFIDVTENGKFLFDNFFHNGAFSVDFFFILSGFCITLGYGSKFDKLDKSQIKAFIVKRFKKIYPLYFLSMLFVTLFNVLKNHEDPINQFFNLLLSATMLQSLTIVKGQILNSAGWFISCIFILYILTPFLIFFIKRIRNNKNKMLLTILISYSIIILVIVLCKQLISNGKIDEYTGLCIYYISPYVRVLYYIIGIALAFIYQNTEKRITLKTATVFEVMISVCLVASYLLEIHYSITGLGVPFIVIAILIFAFDKGRVSEFLGNKTNTFLGSLSMEIYIIHYLVINYGGVSVLRKIFGETDMSLFIEVVILFIITIFLSVCYQFIINRLFKRS